MRKIILIITAIIFSTNIASANDGVYFTSGSFLVPVKETDISAKKEILTITICKDGYANVDVDYTFFNNSNENKSVVMAFEARPPYNVGETLHRDGKHPFISNFTVEMNGASIAHRNGIVALDFIEGKGWETGLRPLDMTRWKGVGEVPDSILPFENAIYNEALDSAINYAYAYYFDATFNPGENKVHHTYRYKMSYSVGSKFDIYYWLTPVTRWANGQVDDFTLKVNTEEFMTEDIVMADSLFKASEFAMQQKVAPIYHIKREYEGSGIFTTISSENALEWHSINFSPNDDLCIESGDVLSGGNMREYATNGMVVIDKDGNKYRYLADMDDGYFVESQDYGVVPKEGARVEFYDAELGQGVLYLNSDTKSANIRASASTKSPILCVINDEGELPEAYPCLGMVTINLPNGDYKQWFKIRVGKHIGYVSRDLMTWDSICTF